MNLDSEIQSIRSLSPQSVVFLCVANSLRSQLAEAIFKHCAPPHLRFQSAGVTKTHVHPWVFEALQEVNISSDGLYSKSWKEIDFSEVDLVITLCAEQHCFYLPLGEISRISWEFEDPQASLDRVRAIRDELIRRCNKIWPLKIEP